MGAKSYVKHKAVDFILIFDCSLFIFQWTLDLQRVRVRNT